MLSQSSKNPWLRRLFLKVNGSPPSTEHVQHLQDVFNDSATPRKDLVPGLVFFFSSFFSSSAGADVTQSSHLCLSNGSEGAQHATLSMSWLRISSRAWQSCQHKLLSAAHDAQVDSVELALFSDCRRITYPPGVQWPMLCLQIVDAFSPHKTSVTTFKLEYNITYHLIIWNNK